jgi:Methyltransferase domain
MEAMRHAPAGDVVEIGAGWGRASALLVWLAKRYQIGAVLCIDPWADGADADPGDPDETLRIFEINLAPLADGRLNYLRAPSADAAVEYRSGLTVRTEAFGATAYEGRIAFLHIAASQGEPGGQDCALWAPRIVPGGWVVFDDYNQALADGARRAAGAFLAREAGRIAARFEAGGALFIQLKR